jgi:hypothetical protein
MIVHLMQESIYNFASNLETIFSPVLEPIEVLSVPNIDDGAGRAHTSASKCIKKLVINMPSLLKKWKKVKFLQYLRCIFPV